MYESPEGWQSMSCAKGEQVEKALKLTEIGKIKVASSGRGGARNGGGCKGVITGVPLNVSTEEFKRNFKGGKILDVLRMT